MTRCEEGDSWGPAAPTTPGVRPTQGRAKTRRSCWSRRAAAGANISTPTSLDHPCRHPATLTPSHAQPRGRRCGGPRPRPRLRRRGEVVCATSAPQLARLCACAPMAAAASYATSCGFGGTVPHRSQWRRWLPSKAWHAAPSQQATHQRTTPASNPCR